MKFKNGVSVTAEKNSNVVLEFSTDKSCHMNSITFTNVTNASSPGVYCSFLHMKQTCANAFRSANCYCDPVTSYYRITISFTGLSRETWKLTGEVANNTTFTETINISVKCKYDLHISCFFNISRTWRTNKYDVYVSMSVSLSLSVCLSVSFSLCLAITVSH